MAEDRAIIGGVQPDEAGPSVTNLAKLAKTRLKKMQYTHDLVDGFFKATGLSPP